MYVRMYVYFARCMTAFMSFLSSRLDEEMDGWRDDI